MISFNATTKINPKPGDFRYRARSTGSSSARYGACEVCHEHCSEVFIQTTLEAFALEPGEPGEENGIGWAHRGCKFGHEACLVGLRKEAR